MQFICIKTPLFIKIMIKKHILFCSPFLDKFIFEMTYNCSPHFELITYITLHLLSCFLVINWFCFNKKLQHYYLLVLLADQNPFLLHQIIIFRFPTIVFLCKGMITTGFNPLDLCIVIMRTRYFLQVMDAKFLCILSQNSKKSSSPGFWHLVRERCRGSIAQAPPPLARFGDKFCDYDFNCLIDFF
jgi:hypothetical protein